MSDNSYRMYEFKKTVHKERGIRFPKDKTYIDHGENKLRIKVKLYGWALGKARYHVTYYVYGRKRVPSTTQAFPLTAELIDTLETESPDTEEMPDVTPTISLKLPGDSEEQNKISVMLKDIYAPLDTAKMTLSFDPEKVSIKDVKAPILPDPELRIVIKKKEIDQTRGIVKIEAIVEDLDPTEVRILEGNELLDDDYVDDNEVDTECVAPILHLILDPAAGSEASSIALAQNSLRIQSVELKDVDGEIIKVELPQITYAHSFSPGWNLMSIPVDPVDPSVEAVIGDDVSPYFLFDDYDNASGDYSPSTEIHLGEGYWLWIDSPAIIDVEGTPGSGNMVITLADGWTMLGTPSTGNINFLNATVTKDGVTKSLWEAAVPPFYWIYPYLFGYNTVTSSYYETLTMIPWTSYWFYAFESGCTLTIPLSSPTLAPAAAPTLIAEAAAKLSVPPLPVIPGLPGMTTETGSKTSLSQNYPNPLNPETFIPYTLAESGKVSIRIYNLAGELIRVLNLGKKDAGTYTTKSKAAYWDGQNEAGEEVSSGVYFYQLQVGSDVMTRKMIVLK